MTRFLVELYLSRADLATFGRDAARARLAAETLSRNGRPVRYLHSIFVPEDETCFHLYEAASVENVREVATRASLPFARISTAVSVEGRVTAAMSGPSRGSQTGTPGAAEPSGRQKRADDRKEERSSL